MQCQTFEVSNTLVDQERWLGLAKAELRSYDVRKETAMPSYATSLAPDEVSDVIAYLRTLAATPKPLP